MARMNWTCAALVVAALAPVTARAATFVVPPDRELIPRADAVVIASVVETHSRFADGGQIETVTTLSREEVIKGNVPDQFEVVEPGGSVGSESLSIAGVPQFDPGATVLLFLKRTGAQRWAVADLVVGKFTFRRDVAGRLLLVRDEEDVVGWESDLSPHQEVRRDAARFLQFVRDTALGRVAATDYIVDKRALEFEGPRGLKASSLSLAPAPAIAPYSATSYTMTVGSGSGSRWTVFPAGVTFYSGTTAEPGAPGGGVTAIQTAFASWNNDCASNVNYVYGGTDNGTHTSGLHGPDGANTILFERDLSAWGVSPFTCTASSYSGTLGLGGVTSASGTNTLNGETFSTTREADVEMNQGIANCSLLFSRGDFNSAVAHEVGHTLGFRHSDQNRSGGGACSSDPSLECSSTAIMKSFVTGGLNGALQVWDQHAVQAVYPGNICVPGSTTCTPPVITSQPQSRTISAGTSTTLTVAATGTSLSYQWYVGPTGSTVAPVPSGSGPSVTVTPSSTTSYWVRVSSACGTVDSATATVTLSSSPSPGNPAVLPSTSSTVWRIAAAADMNGDGYSDLIFQNSQTGQIYVWTMQGTTVIATDVFIGTTSTPAWQVRAAADFNRDGNADLLLQNTSTGTIYIWTMSRTTVLSRENFVRTTSSPAWLVVGAGDFNTDGQPDLLFQNQATNQVVVWTMNGLVPANTDNFLSTSSAGWTVQGVGDFNRDGYSDVVFRNAGSGQEAVWYTSALRVVSRDNFLPPRSGSSWRIAAVGDFDRDGYPDLVWQNTSTRAVEIWLMTGLALK